MIQDINVEEVLKMMCTIDGATEYLVTNSEGKENDEFRDPNKKKR